MTNRKFTALVFAMAAIWLIALWQAMEYVGATEPLDPAASTLMKGADR